MSQPSEPALRVGLTFNLKRSSSIDEAEFDSPATIAAITAALESFGHTVVPLEANAGLPRALVEARPDIVFNFAEGFRGRSREAQVPALLEMLGIPYTGSDPLTLASCHDKSFAKLILNAAGIATPTGQALETGDEPLVPLRYPVIVKPNAEGSSKGIGGASVVFDEASARAAARALIDRFEGSALIEEYICGRELTVGLLGDPTPRVLPPLETVFLDRRPYPVLGYDEKADFMPTMRFDCPADLTQDERERVEQAAHGTFVALRCRDVARIDLRLAEDGTVYVIECNGIPGLTPDFSMMCLIARAAGLDFRGLVGEILAGCLHRRRGREARTR